MRTRLLIAGPMALIASLFLATSAMAGIRLTVTTTADNTATDDNNGVCTLREAVEASNSNTPTTDCPSSGTPSENQIGFAAALGAHPVVNLNGGFGDLEVATNDLTITGPATVMQADPGFRVINSNNNANLTLTSLTISGGSDITGQGGGGIRIITGRLFLNGSSVTGNTETYSGATSGNAQGGGIFSNGAPVTLTDSNVSNNQAIATLSGAASASALALGGGMEVVGDDVTLENSVVSGNQALASSDATSGSLEGDGGGIRTDGAVTIEHSTISGNLGSSISTGNASSAAQGGGLLVHGTGDIDLELSTIANNRVKSTGGATPLTRGGGVADQAMGTDDNFISDTIAGNGLDPGSSTSDVQGLNFASVGLGIGSRTFENTIIANPVGLGSNCSGDTPYSDGVAPTPNVEFPGDMTSPCFDATHMNIMHVDPQLGALGNNGGPTPTMVPMPTSPVIDQGTAADQNDLTQDQRGLTRPVVFTGLIKPFDGSDIGAVEVQLACAGQATPTTTCAGPPPPPPPPTSSTGQRAAAVKKCKKKFKGKAKAKKRKKCLKKANKKPV